MNIDNQTKQTEEDPNLIKQTLTNVTFYQFTPLDITRTLFNETINNLVGLNKSSTSSVLNQTSSVIDQNEINKTGSLLPSSTGVSLTHPDLSIYRSMSFVNGNLSSHSDFTDDKNGHGSHIAGIINAKDNGFGIVGIVPEDNIRIWSMKVCSDDGICSLSDQIKAIEYITKNSDLIDVVNYSIENPYSKLLEQAISESVKAGITYVVAAGNFAKNATSTTSPASNPDVITVSAIGDSDGKCGGLGPLLDGGRMMDDTFADFSNFGPSIDVAAPGVDILSTFNGSDYGILTGTSMAVPHVTGLAAYLKTINPNANPDTLKEMITKSGSSPDSECQVNKGIGYFMGDVDNFAEPLIVLPKEIIRDNSVIGVDATNTDNGHKTNATNQELPTTKTNVTKQELPAASPTTTETKIPAAKPTTKTNVTKQELPTTIK
jgi:subtilisin family serine protease